MVPERETAAHRIVLDGRERLSLTGVLDVDSYDERTINTKTSKGLLTVEGDGLHVMRLSLEDGILEIEGLIGALYYSETQKKETGGFLSRLFR